MKKQYQIICVNCGPIQNKELYHLPGKFKMKCPQCDIEDTRENFGPTHQEQIDLDIAFEFSMRGIQATIEGDTEESKKLIKKSEGFYNKLSK